MDEYEIFLENHKNKCRCCFEEFKKGAKSVKITKEIENLFLDLTQLELKSSRKKYSQNICRSCFSDLKKFSKLKEDLITKQKKLYEVTDESDELEQKCHEYSIKDSFVKIEVKQEIEDLLNESTSCIILDQNDSIRKVEPVVDIKQDDSLLFLNDFPTNIHDNETSSDSSQGPFDEFFKSQQIKKQKRKNKYKPNRQTVTKFFCSYCSRYFQKEETLRTHVNSVHFSKLHKNFLCTQCDFKTYSGLLLKGHVNRIHERNTIAKPKPEQNPCPVCGLLVKKVSTHMRNMHTRPKNFFCDICGFGIYTLSRLRRHMNRHLSKETKIMLSDKYICDICGARLRSRNAIQSHIKNLHQEMNNKYTCHCGRSYKALSYLKVHQKAHDKDLKHKCRFCHKLFMHLSQLKIHMETHERKGRKDFTCEICGKKFGTLSLMQGHKIFHTEPTIPCPHCDKKYHRSCILNRHIKRAHEVVLSECVHCGKQLNVLAMPRHVREFHTGLQKSTCPVPGCNSAYLRRFHLKDHIERVHKDFISGLSQDEKDSLDQHINEMNLI